MDFPLSNGAYRWRALRLTNPVQRGWDVVALQTGLLGVQMQLPKWGPDGFLGEETSKATYLYQERRGLVEDGIAGGATQRAIALQIAARFTQEFQIIRGLIPGQLEYESSLILGNHSVLRSDGTRDCGVTQRNSAHTPIEQGFNTFESIKTLARHLRTYYERYRDWGVPSRRAWELAAGAWNAPAWADKLAKDLPITDAQRAHIEAYIAESTALVRWNQPKEDA